MKRNGKKAAAEAFTKMPDNKPTNLFFPILATLIAQH
jgi:hypothetical protein